MMRAGNVPRIGLVGVSGYSRVHLEHLWAMHLAQEIVLAAVVVIDSANESATCIRLREIGCEILPDFAGLIADGHRLKLDLCIVPSPIHLHTPQTIALLEAGIHVLVEKPLAPTTGEVDAIERTVQATGRLAMVGFQYLHAPEVRALKQRVVEGELGALRRISVYAAWPRSLTYYRRNGWAGRLRVGEAWVLDSPIANAMAHFFQLLLFFAGESLDSGTVVQRMSAELYRAQDIESFDTAVVSMRAQNGCLLDFYGTHSSRDITRPVLVIEGERGRAEWMQDSHASSVGLSGAWRQTAAIEAVTREHMLHDVLARLSDPTRFVCTPRLAREHVRCVNALLEHVPIKPIPAELCAIRQESDEVFTYVRDLDRQLDEAFLQHSGLQAIGTAWAVEPTIVDLRAYTGIGSATVPR